MASERQQLADAKRLLAATTKECDYCKREMGLLFDELEIRMTGLTQGHRRDTARIRALALEHIAKAQGADALARDVAQLLPLVEENQRLRTDNSQLQTLRAPRGLRKAEATIERLRHQRNELRDELRAHRARGADVDVALAPLRAVLRCNPRAARSWKIVHKEMSTLPTCAAIYAWSNATLVSNGPAQPDDSRQSMFA